MAANIMLNTVGAGKDAVTELKTRTNFGRPDFKRFFGEVRDGIMDGSYLPGLEASFKKSVGVYFCGPSVAGKGIKAACRDISGREVQFKFWKEQF